MQTFRIGIIGSGLIAEVVTQAINNIPHVEVSAVASRKAENAEIFAKTHNIAHTFADWRDLIKSDAVDAVYLACPTAYREGMAIGAAQYKKHVLAEKPFASSSALQNMIQAAMSNGVAFMDATHFTHHPRTQQIQAQTANSLENIQALRSAFFFPLTENSNIRFDLSKEPMGLIGDMTWYNMRAIVEFMQPKSTPVQITGYVQRNERNALVRGSGLLIFEDGKTATLDFGYNVGACLMDLDLLGQKGVIQLSDFVLDWKSGFAFDDPHHETGYLYRKEMQSPKDAQYIAVDNETPQVELMINNFVNFSKQYSAETQAHYSALALKTQELVDLYWNEVCLK